MGFDQHGLCSTLELGAPLCTQSAVYSSFRLDWVVGVGLEPACRVANLLGVAYFLEDLV